MNVNEIKFRASSIHHLMTESRKKGELSKTCQTHCIDVFASWMYGRREEIQSKYTTKGTLCEEQAITLYSRVSKTMFKKNETRLENEFISGEFDLFIGSDMDHIEETIDTKTPYSLHTFLRSKHKELEDAYYWQGMAYMALTGAKKHSVAFCLVNGLDTAIDDEKRRLAWSMNLIDTTGNEVFYNKCMQIEKNHIFDMDQFLKDYPHYQPINDVDAWHWDIPKEQRVHVFEFERNEAEIQAIYDRVKEAREFIKTLI